MQRAPNEKELQKLISIFLKAETDIINEIGRLRSKGLIDYHEVAALDRVQAILQKMVDDCWIWVPLMIEKQFYVRVPEARRILEPVSKHIAGYANAEVLTSTQYDVVQKLTNNLMGEITEASETVRKNLDDLVIGRLQPDIFRQRGLEQVAGMEAAGTGAIKTGENLAETLRRDGVTAFTDRAGRDWSLHTYGSMVARTTSRQAEVLAVLTADPENDLYQISSHGTTCKVCAPFEGRVYSRSGTNPDFPPLAIAFGKVDPAGTNDLSNTYLNIHPSCLHALMPWTPVGLTDEEIQKAKDFSSIEKNPLSIDPRTEKQIKAYRDKERARAKWLQNYKQWERYKVILGNKVPKTFDTFLKHKMAGDDKFRAWEKEYRAANKAAKEAEDGLQR